MYPKEVDLKIYQGATFTMTEIYSVDGSPVDVSGYAANLTLTKLYSCDGPFGFDETEGLVLRADGSITLTITDEETVQLGTGSYSYILLLNDGTTTIPFLKGMGNIIGTELPSRCYGDIDG